MDKKYQIAFSEVLDIINKSEKEISEKIPQKFILFLEEYRDTSYTSKIDYENEDWMDHLKPETLSLIALIYRDYVASAEEKKLFIKEQNEKLQQIEEELRIKYNPDNIFENSKSSNNQNEEKNVKNEDNTNYDNKQLIEYEGGFFRKLINKVLIFLRIKVK